MGILGRRTVRTMEGVITLAQESRFQLVDDHGVAHLFVLSSHAGAEAFHLAALQRVQARLRVAYKQAPNLIAFVASSIERCADRA